MDHRPLGGTQVVGRADGDHQGVGGPHGEPDGEEQTEDHQLGAGVPAHVEEVGPDDVHHVPGQELPQGQEDGGDVQIQHAQQGADEDQEGENHKQQVEGQGGALDPHVVAEVALDEEIGPPGQLALHGGLTTLSMSK